MALSTTQNRVSYSGNGVTTAFSFPYLFFANGDLTVLLVVNSTGVSTTQAITSDYTVSGAGQASGGTITMLTAPASGETLIIFRDIAQTQGVDLRENDSLPAEEVEQALDRSVMISQRLNDQINRAVKLNDGFVDDFDPTLPINFNAANATLAINDAGDGFVVGPTTDTIDQAIVSQQAAAASAAAAKASEDEAQEWATKAEDSTVDGVEFSAKHYAAKSSASATQAQNAVESVLWRDVVFLTNSNSPYSVTTDDRAKLFAVDTAGGAVVINLPEISSLDLTTAFPVGVKKTSGDGNSIVVNRGGTDTIDGLTSKTVGVANAGLTLIPDIDPSPDSWTSLEFGSSAGNLLVDRFNGNASTVTFTLSESPGSKNNTFVYIDGVYQQKDTYSISGADLTFSSAPPTGTNNIEIVIGTLLSIGTPADGTVTRAKLAAGAVGRRIISSISSATTASTSVDIYLADTSGGAFNLTLPPAGSNTGKVWQVKYIDSGFANALTVTDGTFSTTLNTENEMIELVDDGSSYTVVDRKIPSEWKSFTPSIVASFGTISNVALFCRRVGDTIEIKGRFTTGTTASSEARLGFPLGITSAGIEKIDATLEYAGYVSRGAVASSTHEVYIEPAVTYFTFGLNNVSQAGLIKLNGNAMYGNFEDISLKASAAINGWNS